MQVSQPVTQDIAALYKEDDQCKLDLTKSIEKKLKQNAWFALQEAGYPNLSTILTLGIMHLFLVMIKW